MFTKIGSIQKNNKMKEKLYLTLLNKFKNDTNHFNLGIRNDNILENLSQFKEYIKDVENEVFNETLGEIIFIKDIGKIFIIKYESWTQDCLDYFESIKNKEIYNKYNGSLEKYSLNIVEEEWLELIKNNLKNIKSKNKNFKEMNVNLMNENSKILNFKYDYFSTKNNTDYGLTMGIYEII